MIMSSERISSSKYTRKLTCLPNWLLFCCLSGSYFVVEEMRLFSLYGEDIIAGTTRAVSTGFQYQPFCTWNAGHPENQPVKIQCQEFTRKLPIPQKDHVGVEKIFTLQTPPKIANLESRDVIDTSAFFRKGWCFFRWGLNPDDIFFHWWA